MGDVKLLFGKIDLFSGDGMIPFKIRTIVRESESHPADGQASVGFVGSGVRDYLILKVYFRK